MNFSYNFSNYSGDIFHELYCFFYDYFKKGEILLGGSLYYHLLGMTINRSPGDIDLIVNHSNIDLQKKISFYLDKVGNGINTIEKYSPRYKQIGISRVIHHKSGVRIELSQGILDDVYFKKIDNYDLFHFNPDKLISNLFLYFRVYFKAYYKYKNDRRNVLKDLYIYKLQKMYSNILMIAQHHKINYNDITCNYKIYLDKIYQIFEDEDIQYFNINTYLNIEINQYC